MKTSISATFVALAVLLSASAMRAGDQNWRKLETDFRRDLAYRDSSPAIELVRPNQSGAYVFPWKPAEWSQILAHVHLMPAHSRFEPRRISYKIQFSSGDYVHDTQAIRLDAGADRGWIELESPDPKQAVKWNRFQLTPASCRYLKKQIWAKLGPQFRALSKLRHLGLEEPPVAADSRLK